ncbi:MAG: hypothetical protein V3W41_22375 [Planctomycetota bacterium]
MAFMDWIRCFRSDIAAWRRGDRRIAKRPVVKGRVYAKRGSAGGGPMAAPLDGVPTIELSAVICGKTGKRYSLEEWRKLKQAKENNHG